MTTLEPVLERAPPLRRRREEILNLVLAQEFVTVQDLSNRFGVSIVTVRADLDELADRGLLRRVRGGAIASLRRAPEVSYEQRGDAYAPEKALIAQLAVSLLAKGDTLLLDVGTTTMAIAREIVARTDLEDLTVVTNGLNIASSLELAIPRVQVLVTGGSLRSIQHSLVGPMAGLVLHKLRASIAFIGADGIHPEHGISTTNAPEADMKQRLLESSRRRVVVADSSKLTREALVRVCDLADVDLILTAGDIDPSTLSDVRSHVEVRVAGTDG
ncbi:MAG: DeoR/GlpR family DNA-binding transcription regulator [Gaiellaceae bacterium]